jgi:phage FluMu protein Com
MTEPKEYWPMHREAEGWMPDNCPKCGSIEWEYDAGVEMFRCQEEPCSYSAHEHPTRRQPSNKVEFR